MLTYYLARKSNKHMKMKRRRPEDYVPREGEIAYGSWDRSECFKVERGLLTFGYAIFHALFCYIKLLSLGKH